MTKRTRERKKPDSSRHDTASRDSRMDGASGRSSISGKRFLLPDTTRSQNLRLRARRVMVNRIRTRTKGWKCLRMSKITVTTYGEWFKIDYNEALGRIQIWWNRMKREPYDLGGVLAPEWEEQIGYLSRENTMPSCSGRNKTAINFGKASWRPRDCLGLIVFSWPQGEG